MNKNECLKSIDYLNHIISTDIPEEVKSLVDRVQREVVGEERRKKEHREQIRLLLHDKLKIYSRTYFYERVQRVVDYCAVIDVKNSNDTSDEKKEMRELADKAIQKMEGILVTTSYLGVIEGYTRQNIHVLVKKNLYENHLVGELYGFKLMDVLEGGNH